MLLALLAFAFFADRTDEFFDPDPPQIVLGNRRRTEPAVEVRDDSPASLLKTAHAVIVGRGEAGVKSGRQKTRTFDWFGYGHVVLYR